MSKQERDARYYQKKKAEKAAKPKPSFSIPREYRMFWWFNPARYCYYDSNGTPVPTPAPSREQCIPRLPVEVVTGSRLYLSDTQSENPQVALTITTLKPHWYSDPQPTDDIALVASQSEFWKKCKAIVEAFKDAGDIDTASGLIVERELKDYLGSVRWNGGSPRTREGRSNSSKFWGYGYAHLQNLVEAHYALGYGELVFVPSRKTDITEEVPRFLAWKEAQAMLKESEEDYRLPPWNVLLAEATEQVEKEIDYAFGLATYKYERERERLRLKQIKGPRKQLDEALYVRSLLERALTPTVKGGTFQPPPSRELLSLPYPELTTPERERKLYPPARFYDELQQGQVEEKPHEQRFFFLPLWEAFPLQEEWEKQMELPFAKLYKR